jgi:hypothetical protein
VTLHEHRQQGLWLRPGRAFGIRTTELTWSFSQFDCGVKSAQSATESLEAADNNGDVGQLERRLARFRVNGFKTPSKHMGARTTLNQIHFSGAVVLASIAGLATESWLVFGVSLGLLLAANVRSRRIRPAGRRYRRR